MCYKYHIYRLFNSIFVYILRKKRIPSQIVTFFPDGRKFEDFEKLIRPIFFISYLNMAICISVTSAQ